MEIIIEDNNINTILNVEETTLNNAIVIEEIISNPILNIEETVLECSIEVSEMQMPGKSAYQSALDGGFVGTELEFNTLLAEVGDKQDKVNWFTLASGYETINDLPNILTGEVIQYTYLGGVIYYRFIASDESEDSFYANYIDGVFSNLIATKKITI